MFYHYTNTCFAREDFSLCSTFFVTCYRSNKTLYGEVSLIPLPADYKPTAEELPGVGTEESEGKTTKTIIIIFQSKSNSKRIILMVIEAQCITVKCLNRQTSQLYQKDKGRDFE